MSATAPARPTPPSCTPDSTPRPARWSRAWSRAATRCCRTTPHQAGIPVERTGALLVAWTPEELAALPALQDKAERNGYQHTAGSSTRAEVYRRVPALGPGALAGLTVPDESIICTWTTTLALATDAVRRGVELRFGHRVTRCRATTADHPAFTAAGDVQARWVVNAAGLGADLDRPDVRPRPVHRHPAPRRIAGLRQAGPAVGRHHRAAGAVQAGQGRADQSHHLRQRDARPDGRAI